MSIELGTKVVVTTEYRGVFFGTLAKYDRESRFVALADARNCLYWPRSNKGFIGLAVDGPKEGARVGQAVATLELAGITSVMGCTDEAIAAWESETWT